MIRLVSWDAAGRFPSVVLKSGGNHMAIVPGYLPHLRSDRGDWSEEVSKLSRQCRDLQSSGLSLLLGGM